MTVPPQLPTKVPCPLAFIGEAPGETEEREGRPLCGPSGRVFNALLKSAGIRREECLVTNVFDLKAPENDVDPWIKDAAVYGPALTRLAAELEAAAPVVTVPLGDAALWALCERQGIIRLRGNVMAATRLRPGSKLVPTLHPAFVMREYKFFAPVVGDLHRALREVERGPEIVRPLRRLLLDPTLDDVRGVVPKLLASPLLSVDIETAWGQITHIGFAWTEEDALCVPFVDLRKPTQSYWATAEDEVEVWGMVRDVLAGPGPKVGQNFGGYDALWLLQKMGFHVKNYLEDTRLEHHALYPELAKSLAFLGSAYSDQGPWKSLGKGGRTDEVSKGDD